MCVRESETDKGCVRERVGTRRCVWGRGGGGREREIGGVCECARAPLDHQEGEKAV